MILLYLSSGLFLGWSLGANDAANIFGTAVGSKMVRFRTAAIISSLSILLGSWLSGRGASRTLEHLGEINEIAGAFVVALAAAVTLYGMTRMKLPVSATQSIVGAIVGWNYFSGSVTDYDTFRTIAATWAICPALAAVFCMILYLAARYILMKSRIHLIKLDFYNRIGLLLVGAFGAYSLGASNIANVMGVFTQVSPFKPLDLYVVRLTSVEQLFILGGIAIGVGVFTYSHRVMSTVGEGIVKLNPVSALTVVLASSLVLFLFASQDLQYLLASHGLPTIPLVPVSSTQAIVGAVIGIGVMHGGRGINYRVVGKIVAGWVVTPVVAGAIAFIALFIFQNVFMQRVYRPVEYTVSPEVVQRLARERGTVRLLVPLRGRTFKNAISFRDSLAALAPGISPKEIEMVLRLSRVQRFTVNTSLLTRELKSGFLTPRQASALRDINGMSFTHTWQMQEALAEKTKDWAFREDNAENRQYNKVLRDRIKYLVRRLSQPPAGQNGI
ncbi:MAG: anion permease [Spirochaetes bacterium]|nr:anion permease [Spirochaetota bacterium]